MPNVKKSTVPQPTGNRESAKETNKLARRRNRGTGKQLDFDSVDAHVLLRAVRGVLEAGMGITFGITRDKGAFSVTLLSDGETEREYVRATEDINAYLTGLAEDFEE